MSVYVWGCNKSKQLVDVNDLHSYTPHLCSLPDELLPLQVAAGDEHSLVLSESGEIFAYGSNKDGQLGTGKFDNSHRVSNLDNETVIGIAAGAHTSYAITANGKVYHWGLIHRDSQTTDEANVQDENNNLEEAQAGRLTGMAQDQDTIIIQQDQEERQRAAAALSRRERAEAAASRRGRHQDFRTLREVVRESTERWLLSSDDADQEYYEELRAMGYHVEEMEEMVQGRGHEYHGMIKMGCVRYMQKFPLKIDLPEKVFISSVSAGYAHVMLLSNSGLLYAAGYNDRGQLGLGHRINTSSFKLVEFLANKFVVEISCGQQHTICRAVDRGVVTTSDSRVYVNSDIGADAYVWGIGILGQLGLGRRGTTKGRLLPTINPSLHYNFPNGIVSVSAGANFTAVVTVHGDVFSFGHAEYNQHGTGNISTRDYVDPYYYFEPREVPIISDISNPHRSNNRVKIKSVHCGGIFTVAIDETGDLYTWGWNESGVLGHGIAYFSAAPKRIESVGFSAQNSRVKQVSCGNKHVIISVESPGNVLAGSTMKRLLLPSIESSVKYYDTEIVIESANMKEGSRYGIHQGTVIRYPCHRALLSARSTYFQGYIRAAQRAIMSDNENSDKGTLITIHLSGPHYNDHNMKVLLEYIYLDRIPIFTTFASLQRLESLKQIAVELGISALESALQHRSAANNSLARVFTQRHPSAAAIRGERTTNVTKQVSNKFESTFVPDMQKILGEHNYADVVFMLYVPQQSKEYIVSFGHRFLLTRIQYLETIFKGQFADCRTYCSMEEISKLESIFQNITVPVTSFEAEQKILKIEISGILQEDVDVETFLDLIEYAYTGHSKTLDQLSTLDKSISDTLSPVMALLILANRVGFTQLAQQCERSIAIAISRGLSRISKSSTQFDLLESCLAFAQHYSFSHLELLCKERLDGIN